VSSIPPTVNTISRQTPLPPPINYFLPIFRRVPKIVKETIRFFMSVNRSVSCPRGTTRLLSTRNNSSLVHAEQLVSCPRGTTRLLPTWNNSSLVHVEQLVSCPRGITRLLSTWNNSSIVHVEQLVSQWMDFHEI